LVLCILAVDVFAVAVQGFVGGLGS
jgi:hypothetical protein